MIDYEALRELAALIAYPNTGQQTWTPPSPRPHRPPTDPTPRRRIWTVDEVATRLNVTPYPGKQWVTAALCRGLATNLFYPERGSNSTDARKLCESCPVRAECLTTALNNGEDFGLWGGLTDKQRTRFTQGRPFGIDTSWRRVRDDAGRWYMTREGETA